MARRGAGLLGSCVARRFTISNSVISFAGETLEFGLVALESHLIGSAVAAVHTNSMCSAYAYRSPGRLSRRSVLPLVFIAHKGTWYHCFQGYSAFHVFLMSTLKKTNPNQTKTQTPTCSCSGSPSLPVCRGVLQHQLRAAGRSWVCKACLAVGSRAFLMRSS